MSEDCPTSVKGSILTRISGPCRSRIAPLSCFRRRKCQHPGHRMRLGVKYLHPPMNTASSAPPETEYIFPPPKFLPFDPKPGIDRRPECYMHPNRVPISGTEGAQLSFEALTELDESNLIAVDGLLLLFPTQNRIVLAYATVDTVCQARVHFRGSRG